MSDDFASYQKALTPAGMAGPYGLAWAEAQGDAKDTLVEEAKVATKARFVDLAPDDALGRLSADRDLDRAPDESSTSWRARIAGAWESWSWLGTRYGITLAAGLLGYGYPSVWAYRELPPDADTSRWARVIVVYRGRPAWDGGSSWDGEDLWDDSRSVDAIESVDPDVARPQLRRVLRKWINARDVVDRVVIAYGSLLWDLDALWDGEDLWDAGDGETIWQSPDWDSTEDVTWDDPSQLYAWDAFC